MVLGGIAVPLYHPGQALFPGEDPWPGFAASHGLAQAGKRLARLDALVSRSRRAAAMPLTGP